MRKFYTLLTLLFMLCGATAMAQDLPFRISDAPSNGQWATNTYWYTIKNYGNHGGYINTASLTNSKLNLTDASLNSPTDESEQWCFVGDNTNGFHFYNKSEGTEKVLCITNNSSSTWGSDGASMMDYSSSSSSSTNDGEAGFLFIFEEATYYERAQSLNTGDGWCIRLYNTGNRYLNDRNGYLSYWDSPKGLTGESNNGDAGNTFKIVNVALSNAQTILNNVSESSCSDTYYGSYSLDLRNALNTAASTYSSLVGTDEGDKALTTAYENFKNSSSLPTETFKAYLGNRNHTDYYAKAGTTEFEKGTGKNTYEYLFTFIPSKDSEGNVTYKIRSDQNGKYVGALPNAIETLVPLTDDESSATYFTIESANSSPYFWIYDKNDTFYYTSWTSANLNALHMGNNGIVQYTKEEAQTASQFSFIKVTDEDIETYYNNSTTHSSDKTVDAKVVTDLTTVSTKTGSNYIGPWPNAAGVTAAATALNTYKSSPTVDNYLALETALEENQYNKPQAGHYYTITNAANYSSNYRLCENYGETKESTGNYRLWCSTPATINSAIFGKTNHIPFVWQFEAADADGYYYIKNPNSGKYVSVCYWDYVMEMVDKSSAGTFTMFNKEAVSSTYSNNVTLRYDFTNSSGNPDKGTINVDNEGCTGGMNSNNNALATNNWLIQEITEIPVTISSVGYASVNFPFAVIAPDGVTAYYASEESKTELTLAEISAGTVIAANTPLILYKENGGEYNFTISTETGQTFNNNLQGTTVPATIATGASAYILKNGTKGIGMYLVNSETDRTIPANKGYLGSTSANSESVAKTFNFGEPTGISNAVSPVEDGSNEYYDLQGHRVLYPAHGVFVKGNGKKVYVK